MRIRDIPLADVVAGRNWKRLDVSDDELEDMTAWSIEPCDSLESTDTVVYSALSTSTDGTVTALVVVRGVGTYDWWGDTCEFVNGQWRQVGLEPEPTIEASEEFVANPLPNDPSFSDAYSREKQRAGFRLWRDKIMQN